VGSAVRPRWYHSSTMMCPILTPHGVSRSPIHHSGFQNIILLSQIRISRSMLTSNNVQAYVESCVGPARPPVESNCTWIDGLSFITPTCDITTWHSSATTTTGAFDGAFDLIDRLPSSRCDSTSLNNGWT
jgi:hypothetical protein